MSLFDVAASTATAVVGAVAFAGLSVGLLNEFGYSGLKPVWRRFIGLIPADRPKRRPRVWAALIGVALLLAIEGAIFDDLLTAIERGDPASTAALGAHFVAVAGWLAYLRAGGLRRSGSGGVAR